MFNIVFLYQILTKAKIEQAKYFRMKNIPIYTLIMCTNCCEMECHNYLPLFVYRLNTIAYLGVHISSLHNVCFETEEKKLLRHSNTSWIGS